MMNGQNGGRQVKRSNGLGVLAAFALLAGCAQKELVLDGVRQESLVGARTVLDVLDAEQELFDAEVAAAAAARDSIVAAYRLKAGMGELTAMALDLDAAPYDPDAYYQEVRSAWLGTGDGSLDDPAETSDGRDAAMTDDVDAEDGSMDSEAMPDGG